MTPPIPIGASRKRPSKSCAACRKAKTKCVGLDEVYLHKIEDPNFVPPEPRPRCNRCIKMAGACDFIPSRRKGRPRRTTKPESRSSRSLTDSPPPPSPRPIQPEFTYPDSPTFYDSPDLHSPVLPSRAPELPSVSCHSLLSPSVFPSFPQRRLPPMRTLSSASESDVTDLSEAVDWPALEELSRNYLSEIYPWAPLLTNELHELQRYLSTADALLLSTLACLVDPTLPPPPFPPTGNISISTLQGAAYLVIYHYGQCDRRTANEVFEWVIEEIRILGWAGNDLSKVSHEIHMSEMDAFIKLGFLVWGISIALGALTGNRDLLLADIQLPSQVTTANMLNHALTVLRDATDATTFHSLDERSQREYAQDIVRRADSIYQVAVDYLVSSCPSMVVLASQPTTRLTLESARESAFVVAVMAPSAVLFLNSFNTPTNSLVSPILSCTLNNGTLPPSPARQAISRATRQILDIASSTPTLDGDCLAFRQHSPCWGSGMLAAGWGLLVEAEAIARNGGGYDDESDQAQLENDLDLCEEILRRQTKWPAAEVLRAELGLMRNTAKSS